MKKFETRSQVLLGMLLEEAEEDYRLSLERLNIFKKDNLDEEWHMEKDFNDLLKEKLDRINWLINYESDSYSSAKTKITDTVVTEKGKEWSSLVRISNIID